MDNTDISFYLSRRSDAPLLPLKDSMQHIPLLSEHIEKAFGTITEFTYRPDFVARLDNLDEMNLEYLNVTLNPDSWESVTIDKCQAALNDEKFRSDIGSLGWDIFSCVRFSSLLPSSHFCEYSIFCVGENRQNALEWSIKHVIPDQYIKRLTGPKMPPDDKFLTVLLFGDRYETERRLRYLADNDATVFSMDVPTRTAFYNGEDFSSILIGTPQLKYENFRPLRKKER